jgi:hypothetical protein
VKSAPSELIRPACVLSGPRTVLHPALCHGFVAAFQPISLEAVMGPTKESEAEHDLFPRFAGSLFPYQPMMAPFRRAWLDIRGAADPSR